jgi:hypothetical protein
VVGLLLPRHALTFTPLVAQATLVALQIVAKLLQIRAQIRCRRDTPEQSNQQANDEYDGQADKHPQPLLDRHSLHESPFRTRLAIHRTTANDRTTRSHDAALRRDVGT